MPGVVNETAVDRLLAGIEAGAVPAGIFTEDAALDATVPNWRFSVHGAEAVRHELGSWYADPGQFENVRRSPLPDGELVEFTLGWEEQGIPHACHQAHILRLVNGLVASDTAFCGGRWPASLLAEMQAAAG
ncbi:MAG TPA: hypothetical protein VLX59_07580 [Acidimicrobiales bacterium]|nr:hypothetical protein [Acidimicrobiales bacterium]